MNIISRKNSTASTMKTSSTSMKMVTIYSLIITSSLAQATVVTYSLDNTSPTVTNTHASVAAGNVKVFAEDNANPGIYYEAPVEYGFDSRNNPPGDFSHTSANISSPNKYLSITLQVNPGWRIDLESLTMMIDHQSNLHGSDYLLQWTAIGIGTSAQQTASSTPSSGAWNLNEPLLFPILSPSSTELTFGDTIEFRIAASTIDDPQNLINFSIDNINIQYDAFQVPEPTSASLLGLGALTLIIRRRR